MEIKKESNVIMLPTEDKTDVYINTYIIPSHKSRALKHISEISEGTTSDIRELMGRGYKPQHLYFTVDEKPEVGDWSYDTLLNDIYKLSEAHNKTTLENAKKVVLSTNKLEINSNCDNCGGRGATGSGSCGYCSGSGNKYLSRPSKAFVKTFCEAGGVDEVSIVFEEKLDDNSLNQAFTMGMNIKDMTSICVPKLGADGKAIINFIKEDFSRKEMLKLTENAFNSGYKACSDDYMRKEQYEYSNWKIENL